MATDRGPKCGTHEPPLLQLRAENVDDPRFAGSISGIPASSLIPPARQALVWNDHDATLVRQHYTNNIGVVNDPAGGERKFSAADL